MCCEPAWPEAARGGAGRCRIRDDEFAVTVGVLIAFLMLLLNLRLKPFSDDTLNFINTIAQLSTCHARVLRALRF